MGLRTMRVLFTICARAGSKGAKNKNIRELNGLPMVYYALAAYRLFYRDAGKEITDIGLAINTDSARLFEQAEKTGIPFFPVARKADLAGDTVSKVEVIRDTLWEVEKGYLKSGAPYDIVVDLDLTSPLRRDRDIQGVMDVLMESPWADLAFSVTPSRRLPFFNMVTKKEDGSFGLVVESNFVARQQAPSCYDMNASVYAYRRDFLLREGPLRVFDGKAVIYETPDTGILDIDDERDFQLTEVLADYFFQTDPAHRSVWEQARQLAK